MTNWRAVLDLGVVLDPGAGVPAPTAVMAGFSPAIHDLLFAILEYAFHFQLSAIKVMDAWHKAKHDVRGR